MERPSPFIQECCLGLVLRQYGERLDHRTLDDVAQAEWSDNFVAVRFTWKETGKQTLWLQVTRTTWQEAINNAMVWMVNVPSPSNMRH
jgi:hypothetical protein